MSSSVMVPIWLQTKTGEQASERFLAWIRDTQKKLRKAFPSSERAFCRTLDKLKSRLTPATKKRLHYNRQKHFLVSPEMVFFGDFYFYNGNFLVEVDGSSHQGKQAVDRDMWRSRLIELWKVSIWRITNDEILYGDFRVVEDRFITAYASAQTPGVKKQLLNEYQVVRSNFPAIYQEQVIMTVYRGKPVPVVS